MKNTRIARQHLLPCVLIGFALTSAAAFAQDDQQAPAQPPAATSPEPAATNPAPQTPTQQETPRQQEQQPAPQQQAPSNPEPQQAAQRPPAAQQEQTAATPPPPEPTSRQTPTPPEPVVPEPATKPSAQRAQTAGSAPEPPVEKSKPERTVSKAEREGKGKASATDLAGTTKKEAGAAKNEKASDKAASKADAAGKPASAPAKSETAVAGAPVDDGNPDLSPELKVRTDLARDKFSALDANADGFVDRQEAGKSVALRTMFAKFDADKDGKLSLTEFAAINDLAAIKMDSDKLRKLH